MIDGELNKKSGILVINLPGVAVNQWHVSHPEEKSVIYSDYTGGWTSFKTRKEYEDRYPLMPSRIIDQLMCDDVRLSVVPWSRIEHHPDRLRCWWIRLQRSGIRTHMTADVRCADETVVSTRTGSGARVDSGDDLNLTSFHAHRSDRDPVRGFVIRSQPPYSLNPVDNTPTPRVAGSLSGAADDHCGATFTEDRNAGPARSCLCISDVPCQPRPTHDKIATDSDPCNRIRSPQACLANRGCIWG